MHEPGRDAVWGSWGGMSSAKVDGPPQCQHHIIYPIIFLQQAGNNRSNVFVRYNMIKIKNSTKSTNIIHFHNKISLPNTNTIRFGSTRGEGVRCDPKESWTSTSSTQVSSPSPQPKHHNGNCINTSIISQKQKLTPYIF